MSIWIKIGATLMMFGVAICPHVAAGYTDPQQRFSLETPTGWQVQTPPDESGVSAFASPDGRAKFIILPLPLPESATMADLVSAYEQFVRETQAGIKLVLEKETTVEVAGQSALRREYRVETGDEKPGKVMTTFIKTGDQSLTLHASARTEAEFVTFEPIFRRCLGSLRFQAGGDPGGASDVDSKLKSLEAAYQAGILSDAEYARKKSELEAQLKPAPPPLDEAAQKKLQALEAAHQAGILSDEEYAVKKAQIEASLRAAAPQPDEATLRKLQALEEAHEAGILSDEEYAGKKAQLLGQPAGAQGTPAQSPASLVQYEDPGDRFQFQYPRDWTVQAFPNGQGVSLVRGQAAVNVMLLAEAAGAQELLDSVAQQIRGQWKDYRELQREERKVGGQAVPLVEFAGANPQGVRTRSEMVGLVSGRTGYVLLASAPENEFAAAQPVWESMLDSFRTSDVLPAGKKGKTYSHVTGFSFWYPADWTITEQEGFLQLVPPDPSSTAAGPTELYFVSSESLEGEDIQRPDDPRVIEYMDAQVQTLSPALQRTGTTSSIDMAKGKGAVLDWEATSPTGDVIRARAFVSIIKDQGVMLLAIGLKDRLAARDAILRQMFATFGFGEGQRDPRLVGSWSLVSTYAASNESPFETSYTKARSVSETSSTLVFRADGTWTRTDVSQFIAMGGHNPITGTNIILDSGPQKKVANGRWNAGGGSLYLVWDNDTWEDYKYEIQQGTQGRQLKLVSGNSGETWKEE